jgi:polyphosphate kinase 2 (PPK2 family)
MQPVGRLDELDLSVRLRTRVYEERLAAAQKRLALFRLRAAGLLDGPELGPPLCVVLEGWDASGKGGAINRLVAPLDPRHVRVRSFAAPTPDELRHHWLWRFWHVLPGWGGMAVFDRSWYGRVLVERVEGLTDADASARAHLEIADFERTLAAEGMVIVKLWLHMSAEEQLKRFEKRKDDPLKAWKLTDEDWRNRGKRDEYTEAVELMFERTSLGEASWTLIEGEQKKWARVRVVETVADALEAGLAEKGRRPPPG